MQMLPHQTLQPLIRDLDGGRWLLNCSDTDKNQKQMTKTKTNTKKDKDKYKKDKDSSLNVTTGDVWEGAAGARGNQPEGDAARAEVLLT